MRVETICAALLFSAMIFTPTISVNEPSTPSLESLPEEATYKEPSVSVLNIYDGSVFSVPMEEYLLGVVLSEMPASFEKEALKAQSVAARTYTKGKLDSPAHENADICMDASCCQAYIYPSLYEGGEENLLKVKAAVEGTKGEIMTYDDEP
ncbi:MAG: SpoIID/LytB domain-containing protein, partial [Clostridia bacterium]|nr:SpoIID/LytB domain-containing protein [Clostridia bacterium]